MRARPAGGDVEHATVAVAVNAGLDESTLGGVCWPLGGVLPAVWGGPLESRRRHSFFRDHIRFVSLDADTAHPDPALPRLAVSRFTAFKRRGAHPCSFATPTRGQREVDPKHSLKKRAIKRWISLPPPPDLQIPPAAVTPVAGFAERGLDDVVDERVEGAAGLGGRRGWTFAPDEGPRVRRQQVLSWGREPTTSAPVPCPLHRFLLVACPRCPASCSPRSGRLRRLRPRLEDPPSPFGLRRTSRATGGWSARRPRSAARGGARSAGAAESCGRASGPRASPRGPGTPCPS